MDPGSDHHSNHCIVQEQDELNEDREEVAP